MFLQGTPNISQLVIAFSCYLNVCVIIYQKKKIYIYKNLNSFSQLLLLLSGYISLNPGPIHQGTLQCSNELDVFKNRGLHFIHLNINSLLPKIEKLRFITKSTNAAVIGICESKLEASVLKQETSIDNYKILCCNRNRQGGGVACYTGNDLSYNILSCLPACKKSNFITHVFLDVSQRNSKLVILGNLDMPKVIISEDTI